MDAKRAALQRPMLLPGLRRVWRGPHLLQLGVDPARAVVLELANPAAARLLDLLDGAHSERSIVSHAARCGVSDADARSLVDLLHSAGLVVGAQALVPGHLDAQVRRRLAAEATAIALRAGTGADTGAGAGTTTAAPAKVTATPAKVTATPAKVLRNRAASRVVVSGRGRLGPTVAVALAHAGVGQVYPSLDGLVEPGDTITGGLLATDLGRPRSVVVSEAIERAVPGTDTRPVRRGEASFVVLADVCGPTQLHATAYARYQLAHLSATVRDGAAVVGPLVPPSGSPCLNCLDLHRRDRDPAWPVLAPQLATEPSADPALAPGEPCTAPTVLMAAGLATAEVLAYLDSRVTGSAAGPFQTLGVTIEIAASGKLRRRTWPPHPDCDCAWRRSGRMAR